MRRDSAVIANCSCSGRHDGSTLGSRLLRVRSKAEMTGVRSDSRVDREAQGLSLALIPAYLSRGFASNKVEIRTDQPSRPGMTLTEGGIR